MLRMNTHKVFTEEVIKKKKKVRENNPDSNFKMRDGWKKKKSPTS